MKNNYINSCLNNFAVALLFLGMFSCGDAKKDKTEDPLKVAEKHNEEKFDNETENTASFMVYAADLNMHEIQLGELAQGHGYNVEVQKMARQMVVDHRKALTDLKAIATKNTITLPESVSDKNKKECDKLSEKKRHDFDKEYCEILIEDHKEALKKFEKEAEEGKNEEVRKWAFAQIPSLRTHLDHALALEDKTKDKGDTAVVVDHDGVGKDGEKKSTDMGKGGKKKGGDDARKDW